MEMDAKRMGILKKVNITHYAVVICVVLIFLQWFMPYFRYEPRENKKDTKTQTSMWGEILFNYNFMQLEDVMKKALNTEEKVFKFINLRYLGAPVIMMVCGIIALCTMTKKGIATNIFPLIMAIAGISGWLGGNLIPQFCNVPISRTLGIVTIFLLLICTLANIVCCVQEMKSRPADYYLPSLN